MCFARRRWAEEVGRWCCRFRFRFRVRGSAATGSASSAMATSRPISGCSVAASGSTSWTAYCCSCCCCCCAWAGSASWSASSCCCCNALIRRYAFGLMCPVQRLPPRVIVHTMLAPPSTTWPVETWVGPWVVARPGRRSCNITGILSSMMFRSCSLSLVGATRFGDEWVVRD